MVQRVSGSRRRHYQHRQSLTAQTRWALHKAGALIQRIQNEPSGYSLRFVPPLPSLEGRVTTFVDQVTFFVNAS